MLAETVDRWLFWTFFLITTISTLLFLVILPYRFSFLFDDLVPYIFVCCLLQTISWSLWPWLWSVRMNKLNTICFKPLMLSLWKTSFFNLLFVSATAGNSSECELFALIESSFPSSFELLCQLHTYQYQCLTCWPTNMSNMRTLLHNEKNIIYSSLVRNFILHIC